MTRRRSHGPVTAPIFGFNAARSSIVEEVVHRVTTQTRDPLLALNEAAYLETRRLQTRTGPSSPSGATLAGHLGRMSDGELREQARALRRALRVGRRRQLRRRVYKFASKAMAPLARRAHVAARDAQEPRAVVRPRPRSTDGSSCRARASTSASSARSARSSSRRRTCRTSTRSSSASRSSAPGFPPAIYGAGKNLFTNPVLSYFMHNLGAYRVDRRLRHALYKDVLKTYSCVLIERGYHSLFFPGGTRSRSGGVERKLKLGLAGTGIEAFVRTHGAGRTQPVFFVPATINYLLTLEAETLIDDFLQEEGKARYIIEDDESTRVGRVASFMNKLLGLDGACVIRFSRPLDCFGNYVDDEGRSHDDARAHRRRRRATSSAATASPAIDAARDAEYTRELGERIVDAFKRDTVVMATHVVAAVRVRAPAARGREGRPLRRAPPPRRRRRPARRARRGRRRDARARSACSRTQGEIVLAPTLKGQARRRHRRRRAPRVRRATTRSEVLAPRGSELVLRDTRLLFYYQNRLAAHGLAFDAIAPQGMASGAMPVRDRPPPRHARSPRPAAGCGAAEAVGSPPVWGVAHTSIRALSAGPFEPS